MRGCVLLVDCLRRLIVKRDGWGNCCWGTKLNFDNSLSFPRSRFVVFGHKYQAICGERLLFLPKHRVPRFPACGCGVVFRHFACRALRAGASVQTSPRRSFRARTAAQALPCRLLRADIFVHTPPCRQFHTYISVRTHLCRHLHADTSVELRGRLRRCFCNPFLLRFACPKMGTGNLV